MNPQSNWYEPFVNLGNFVDRIFLPAAAAGLVVLLAMDKLRLWQTSALLLLLILGGAVAATVGKALLEPAFRSLLGVYRNAQAASKHVTSALLGALAVWAFVRRRPAIAAPAVAWLCLYSIILPVAAPFLRDARRGVTILVWLLEGLDGTAYIMLAAWALVDGISAWREKAKLLP